MNEYNGPATFADLKTLIRALNQEGGRVLVDRRICAVCPWLSPRNHGYDVLVPATREFGERVRQSLMVLPDKSAEEVDFTYY